ncbi:hypothetical protein [Virgibacillus ndiopensis]|nr:hypothetical protein [Virgibacillus ndiopensis]
MDRVMLLYGKKKVRIWQASILWQYIIKKNRRNLFPPVLTLRK